MAAPETEPKFILEIFRQIALSPPNNQLRFTAFVTIVIEDSMGKRTKVGSSMISSETPQQLEKELRDMKTKLETAKRNPDFMKNLGKSESWRA